MRNAILGLMFGALLGMDLMRWMERLIYWGLIAGLLIWRWPLIPIR